MKPILILSILFSLFVSETTGQKKASIKDSMLVIYYNETNKIGNYSSSSSIRRLIIINNVSYYVYSNPAYELDEVRPYAGVIKNMDSNYLLFNSPMPPRYDRNAYFSDTLFPMKWSITNKKKDINGRIGYEALTYFRGRYFTAYYDPSIPINDGPIKFGGLPGLIIKLFDKDKIWDFELKSIERKLNSFKPNEINLVGDFELYKKVYPEWYKKYKAKMNAIDKINANCLDCGKAEEKTYSIEIIE